MSDFAENLRNIMFEKRLKAVDLANGTKIAPSVISRYLSGKNKPSTDNIMTIGNYLGVHPQSLLSSSDAPESIQSSQGILPSNEPLLKMIEVQEPLLKIIEVQDKLIKNLETEVVELKATVKENEECHNKIKAFEEKLEAVTKLKNELLEKLYPTR